MLCCKAQHAFVVARGRAGPKVGQPAEAGPQQVCGHRLPWYHTPDTRRSVTALQGQASCGMHVCGGASALHYVCVCVWWDSCMDMSVCLCDVPQGYPDSNRWASLDTGFERPMGALFALLVHRLYVVCVCVF